MSASKRIDVLIGASQWERALVILKKLLSDSSSSALEVTTVGAGAHGLRSTMIHTRYAALHLAVERRPPLEVVVALLHLYPQAASLAANLVDWPSSSYYPLHTACAAVESFEILQALVQANPAITRRQGGFHFNCTPLEFLWKHMSSNRRLWSAIVTLQKPAHFSRLVDGGETLSVHWHKITLLLEALCWQDGEPRLGLGEKKYETGADTLRLGIRLSKASISLLPRKEQELLEGGGESGKIYNIICRYLHVPDSILKTLFRIALSEPLALHDALQVAPWSLVKYIMERHPIALLTPHPESGFVPFQIAAMQRERLDDIYLLLRADPSALTTHN